MKHFKICYILCNKITNVVFFFFATLHTVNFEGFHWNNSLSANLLSMKRVLGKASRLDYSADKECYNLTKGDNSMSIKAKNTF